MNGSDESQRVSVIGLGSMGSALAESLLTGGHRVTVWNRTASKCEALATAGASVAASVSEAATAAQVIVVCVTDHRATLSLANELAGPLNGKVLVQLSTMTADESRELARWAEAQGLTYLEGSILGLPQDVTGSSATIIYAGPQEAFDDHKEVFLAMGGGPQFIGGEIGAAVTFDKVYYAFVYGLFHAFIQGAALAHANGFSIEAYSGICAARLPASVWKLRMFGDMIAARNYDDVQATMEVHAAAFADTLAMCRDLGVDEALPAAVMGNFERAIDAGYGQKEIPALFEVLIKDDV